MTNVFNGEGYTKQAETSNLLTLWSINLYGKVSCCFSITEPCFNGNYPENDNSNENWQNHKRIYYIAIIIAFESKKQYDIEKNMGEF